MLLKGSDLIPLISESLEEDHAFEVDETLIGTPAIDNMDRVGLMGGGSLDVQGYYEGLDQLIACAMGFEDPRAVGTGSPTYVSSTALVSSATVGATKFNDVATNPFVSSDVGKFICMKNNAREGQVRRISGFVNTSEVTITPAWDVTPVSGDTAEMSAEFKHTFECSNKLADDLWSESNLGSYPTGGVGTSSDQIIRRGTLGIEKNQTKPWIWRSCMVNQMVLSFGAGSGLKASFDLVPFDLELDSATNTSSSAWDWDHEVGSTLFPSNERALFPDISYFRIDDFSNSVPLSSADNYGITEFELTINNNLKVDDQDTLTGQYRVEPSRGGMREITGSFKLPRYNSDKFRDWRTNETRLMAEIAFTGSTIDSAARQFKIFIMSLEITNVTQAISGSGVVTQDIAFRALMPTAAPSGMPTAILTAPRSEIVIQTQNQNPYNAFRDQNKEY